MASGHAVFIEQSWRFLQTSAAVADFRKVTPIVVFCFRLTHSRGWLRRCTCWICADQRQINEARTTMLSR